LRIAPPPLAARTGAKARVTPSVPKKPVSVLQPDLVEARRDRRTCIPVPAPGVVDRHHEDVRRVLGEPARWTRFSYVDYCIVRTARLADGVGGNGRPSWLNVDIALSSSVDG
jgi:hypothetical protein